ncbi:MAG: helix-turn-helix domain-containing protein [Myxococcota bacterium]
MKRRGSREDEGASVAGLWQQALDHRFDGRITLEQSPGARGRVCASPLPPVEVLDIAGEAVQVCAAEHSMGPDDWVSIMAQLEGQGTLGHDGGRWELSPGGLVLLDVGMTCRLWMTTAFRQVALVVPRATLTGLGEPRLGTLEGRGHPVDRLLFEALAELGHTAGPGDRVGLATAALGLLRGSSAFGARGSTSPGPSVRVRRARLYIETHFCDPGLHPQQVAHAQQISRRALDRAFARVGTTIAATIHGRRLPAAADLLLTQPERSVLDVALSSGFASASALSHAFRKHFGEPPSVWRARDGRVGQRGDEAQMPSCSSPSRARPSPSCQRSTGVSARRPHSFHEPS